jgi:hypothetical protein
MSLGDADAQHVFKPKTENAENKRLFFTFLERNAFAKFLRILFQFDLSLDFFLVFGSPIHFPRLLVFQFSLLTTNLLDTMFYLHLTSIAESNRS